MGHPNIIINKNEISHKESGTRLIALGQDDVYIYAYQQDCPHNVPGDIFDMMKSTFLKLHSRWGVKRIYPRNVFINASVLDRNRGLKHVVRLLQIEKDVLNNLKTDVSASVLCEVTL